MSAKHILVLGATGQTGLVFIQEALANPSQPSLTLLVRTPSKLPPDYAKDPRITIIRSELNDGSAIEKAVSNNITSVVLFLGAYITLTGFLTRSTNTPIANSLSPLFKGMHNHGVKRIMALSTPAFAQSEDQITWGQWFRSLIPKIVVPEGDAEMREIGRKVAESGLDWTVFRVPFINDGSPELEIVAGYLGPESGIGTQISRRSMSRWVLEELERGEWMRKAPAISN
jgi:nucleoside-diphosphate-sugar epimerase